MKVKWVATLSNGTTETENEGIFKLKPGQRTPWFRLSEHTFKQNLHVTSLRLVLDNGATIHLPRLKAKFLSVPPQYYSLEYMLENSDVLGNNPHSEKRYVIATAHYELIAIRVIIDIDNGNDCWVEIVENKLLKPQAITNPMQPK